jgi:hypothetical protein
VKVENTKWSWISKEEGIQHAARSLNNINMSVTEDFGKYRLRIDHGFKFVGNTYYELKSKDMVTACLEADEVAMKEFKDLMEWNTNLIEELSDMNFYEFNDFGYYALIGASSEEEAIKFYEETVGEIDEDEKDNSPVQISKDEALVKLLNVLKEDEKEHATYDFRKNISTAEPYLVLIDGSLL